MTVNGSTGGSGTASATAILSSLALTGTSNTIGGSGNMTINAAISDGASAGGFNKTGNGTVTLKGSNGYSGGTTVSAGTLYVNNASGSGTGSGAVTVNSTGTLGGSGTITPGSGSTTLAVNGGGKLASGDVQSSSSGTVDGTHFTINNTAITIRSSIGTANLTFDLGTGNSGIGGTNASFHSFSNPNNNTTYLSLTGSSSIDFTGTTSISLVDLTNISGTGNGTLALRYGTPYLLIKAGSNSDYINLVVNSGTAANPIYSLSQNDATVNGYVAGIYTGSITNPTSNQIAGFISPITFSQFGSDGVTALPATSTGIYPAPVLYLDAGYLEVVPEPGTWALMLGGLACLIFIQSRRRRG